MSALDLNFSTGIPGLDGLLHGLKPGDNVVLQVAELEDYVPLVTPFYRRVLAEGKPLIYFRFARHAALVPEGSGAEICRLHPEAGFERFITEAIDVIEQAGRGACYVFDCLSELAVDWYSDRMLGNFFMLACPYLYKLDTIAYFALLKNHHSSVAIDAIQNTAQVYIPVYRHRESIYLQPLKVEGRHSPTMYMLNRWDDDGFHAVRNSAVTSEILTEMAHPWLDFTIHRPGVWTRTFTAARHVLEKIDKGEPPPDGVDTLRNRLLRMAITRDEPIVELASRYLSLADLIQILQRMIGTGLIGGKTLGMLLSRAILVADHAAWLDKLEPHDSFFIGSDVFYTYLVQNGCWWLRRRRRDMTLETVLENASAAREKIATGTFPDDIRHQFVEMLNYFGQAPLIVRSSSLLEDNYGNSFSGKYESVFCANQGT
ncbi:MAG: PEP/pyruvate-binding domain-containing protein, partial [Candidatus Pacebacteria bacterium]|nr:PEP/pyruvate-binding domain-containing protein [Candidatus Paceibacterota bacterium]